MMNWLLGKIQDPYLCLSSCSLKDSKSDCVILRANPAFCTLVGMAQEQLVGYSPASVIPEIWESVPRMAAGEDFELAAAHGGKLYKTYRLEIHQDDDQVHMVWSPIPGSPVWIKCEDAESENRILSYRLLKTQEIGQIGDWYTNLQSNEQYWSEEIYRLLGVEPNAFPADIKKFHTFLHPEDLERVRNVNAQGIDGNEFEQEFRIIQPNGAVRWMHAIGKSEIGWDGKPYEVYGLMQDITEFKLYEQQMLEAKEAAEKANQRKSVYLANMSHEIRIPLSGIAGMTDLMLKTHLSREQKELANYIRYSSDSLIQLINDVLDFSKIEAGKMALDMKVFDLADMLRKLIKAFEFRAKSKGLELSLNVQAGIPSWIMGDPVRIQQILNNLVGNAVKFTSTGSVSVAARLLEEQDDWYKLELSVSDTGIGISQEKQGSVFEDYEQGGVDVTAQFGGTGLGLAICKRLVEMMDGTISFVSTVGQGTTFTAEIVVHKAVAPEVSAGEAEQAVGNGQLEGMRVLIAEDNFINRLFLTKLLEEVHQCRTVAADDGLKALELLKSDRFDCVLMDGHLPGMDGVEVVKEFRAYESGQGIGPDDPGYTKIIALTAEAMKGDEERFLGAGMNYYLTKPIQEGVLVNLLLRIAGEETGNKPRFDSGVPWELSRLNHIRQESFQAFVRRMTEQEILGLVRAALKEYPAKVAEAETALWREDRDAFRRLVHAIRGSLGYFGSDALMHQMQDLENKALTQEMNYLTLRYRELKQELLLFIEDLKVLERYYAYLAGVESEYPVM